MTEGSLELEVTDFGPIKQATIDLRPLTVFVGPSNTGKSWMAVLSYAMHRYFSSVEGPGQLLLRSPTGIPEEKPSCEQVDALRMLAKQAFQEGGQIKSGKKPFVIPVPILEPTQTIFNEQGTLLGNEIRRCLGVDGIEGLIRKASNTGAQVVIRRRLSSTLPPFEHRLTFRSQKADFAATVPEGIGIQGGEYGHFLRLIHEQDIRSLDERDTDKEDWEMPFSYWSLLNNIASLIVPDLFGPLHLPAFYLPADRTGVMHAHNVVVSALIESATMAGRRPAARTPMLSGVLADFLEQLIRIEHPSYRRGESSNEHATRIENAILGGSVHVNRAQSTGHPHFTYQPEGWKDTLPLMNASSMVSELAPVVLYLRHIVKPGNLLIVEEPESHLHPGMQVEFIRQLAALVQSGIRVLITTHSEWVLEELANTVRRSELPSSDKISLRPERVGAWLFKEKTRPKGSVVEEVKLDDETGLYPTGFDEVSQALYNENANIFNRIQDIKHE